MRFGCALAFTDSRSFASLSGLTEAITRLAGAAAPFFAAETAAAFFAGGVFLPTAAFLAAGKTFFGADFACAGFADFLADFLGAVFLLIMLFVC